MFLFLCKRVKSSQINNNRSVEELQICGTRMENNVTKVTGNQTRVNRSFVSCLTTVENVQALLVVTIYLENGVLAKIKTPLRQSSTFACLKPRINKLQRVSQINCCRGKQDGLDLAVIIWSVCWNNQSIRVSQLRAHPPSAMLRSTPISTTLNSFISLDWI